jgi:hypothetical protein
MENRSLKYANSGLENRNTEAVVANEDDAVSVSGTS